MKLKHLAVVAAVTVLSACGGSSGGASSEDVCDKLASDSFSCNALLQDLVSEGVQPVVNSLSANLATLDTKVSAYCEAISNDTLLEEARDAWSDVMAPLQQLQVMNFGPNTDSETGLLPFYDWESASPFNIDIAIAKSALFSNIDLPTSDNEKDLVALEYVLFDVSAVQVYSDPDNENPSVESWRTGKSDEEIQQDRCDYAKLVSTYLSDKGLSLKSAWEGYDFVAASSSKQASANEVAKALFYVDKITKDLKVKSVLPQPDDSGSTFDAGKLESQFANESKAAIKNNLLGTKIMLTLNDSDNSKTALNDYLTAAGFESIGTNMLTTLDAAIENIDAVNSDLYTAVEGATDATQCKTVAGNGTYIAEGAGESSDIDTFCALQYQLKMFTDILKGEFTSSTSFTIPPSASGDND